ncbi:MAG TPA: hypothetical protein VIC06_11595 [Solirubrobacteraceae bacterium]|jgi:hypothetical protein
MAATATVRIRPETRDRLRRLSRERGLSAPDLLDALICDAEDDQILTEHEVAMERLMADPQQAASYRAEIEVWDDALLDGLKELE